MLIDAPFYSQSEGPAKSAPVSYKLPAPFQQSGPITITYDYDPLYRLKEANYSTGDYYHYGYDAVGNRLSQDTQVGGLPITTTYLYDDANRVQSVSGVTYTFDANGNLLNDGINTYTYDSANRLKTMNSGSVTASYTYNGMNDRLQQTVNGTISTFTMDYNTGLTQALSDGTNHYIYGVDRIAQVNAATEYFLGDALGSVRQLTDESGEVTYASAYDPYGVTTSTVGASQTVYGFTGEFASNDLVYLRARHYSPGMGRFLTRDTWAGNYNRPLSLNRWNYVGGNPVNLTDPSGLFPPAWCQMMPNKALYEGCVDVWYGIEPISYFRIGETVTGERGCYLGPSEYRAPGYLEGLGVTIFAGRLGSEVVYDFATMERLNFSFGGGGGNDSLDIGVGVAGYVGLAKGFRTDDSLTSQYRGISLSLQGGLSGDIGIGIGTGIGGFVSWTDLRLRGAYVYVGGSFGLDLVPFFDADVVPFMFYVANPETRKPYIKSSGEVDTASLMTDIFTGSGSPLTVSINRNDTEIRFSENHVSTLRVLGAVTALRYALVYKELRGENAIP